MLLVEDEVGLADAISRGLAAEGFEVEAVHDGLEGLWRAREHRYAAAILDIMLPGMNGYVLTCARSGHTIRCVLSSVWTVTPVASTTIRHRDAHK